MNIFSTYVYTSPVKNIHCHLNGTAMTDLGLRSRTFSLNINKLPTFSEINQGWQCLNNKFSLLVSDEYVFLISSSYSIL